MKLRKNRTISDLEATGLPFEVTPIDFSGAQSNNAWKCPVARALHRLYPQFFFKVYSYSIWVFDRDWEDREWAAPTPLLAINVPARLTKLIEAYDYDMQHREFQFNGRLLPA